MSNTFSRLIGRVNKMPEFCRSWLLTKAFCSKVKFAGTAKIHIDEITGDSVKVILKNKKRVQNHIGGIHACGAALLAESASGIAFAMNINDNSLPLLKSMHVDYLHKMQGDLTAIATVSDEQRQLLAQERGSLVVNVVVTDESGEQPVKCMMEWAWVAKKSR